MTAQARLLGGRYEVGELLGYGGMAEVHRGRDTRLGRDVAVKLLRSDLARDATFQARFRREAQNAAALNHPAIVAVYDTGEDDGPNGESLPYIVMEYVAGRTLKEVLTGEGRLQPRRALEVTADICAALDFSHRHGIIHRDIKPGNVMLTPSGQVKVMDFGIARALSQSQSTMTQTSAVIGTAQYLSPEQARGETVDARSDVYATGCVLYELMCGDPPFTGDNPVSVAYQHVREDPRAPSEANPDVTPDIDAVVLKALAKNTVNRYQSAGEMRADLLRAAAGRPVQATPVMSADERTQLVSPVRPSTATAQHARVESNQRRAARWALVALSLLGVFALVAVGTALYLSNQTPQAVVPNVKDQLIDDATSILKRERLNAKPSTVVNPDCEKGTVLGQNPQGGAKVDQGSTVELTVCGGPAMTRVPKLLGTNQTGAERLLEAAKLTGTVQEVDSASPKGEVVDSDPKEGTAVPEGSEVKILVSRGNMVNVPDVVGLSRDAAEQKLKDAGFKVDIGSRAAEGDEQPGTVVVQEPRGGAKRKGSTVSIIIAVEPEPSETPSDTPSPTPSDTNGPLPGAIP